MSGVGIGVSPSLPQQVGITSSNPDSWTAEQFVEIVKLLVFNRARRVIGLPPALDWQYPRS